MKNILLISVILFFYTLPDAVQAQAKLPDSGRGSENAYLYTISKDNLREIYLNGKEPTEDMLERQVATCRRGADIPELPRGNYMIVTSNENRLNLVDHTVDDLYFKVVPSERMMLCLYDSSGNLIEDAVVKCGSKTLRYDKKSRTYNAKSVKDEQVLEINNNGVFHYIEFEKQSPYYGSHKSNVFKTSRRKAENLWLSAKTKVHYLFNPDDRPLNNKYTGFVVFSKPRYKPGETVKLKAYMTEYNGKPYKKPVDLRLRSYYPERVDTLLTKLSPYRPGMYEYRFKLSDSLNLRLDNEYTVSLSTENYNDNEISGRFKHEEYELKSVRFNASADKKEYAKNDTVRIKLKATDENEMAVYDGKVEVLVFPKDFAYMQGGYDAVFIPDTLWAHTVDLSGISEKELILPDSIFPANVSLHYRVKCAYLSADNEKREQTIPLYRNASDYVIDYALEKGILTIKELHKGQSQEVAAAITVFGENDEILRKDSVQLPYSLPVPWMASEVAVRTPHTNGYSCFDERKLREKDQIGYRFYRNNDSIFLAVDNPAGIPFWYTVRKKNKEIAAGYATQLDYSAKDNGKDGYAMQLSYLFAGGEKCIAESLPFAQKNITIDVSTPTSVYPGQQTNVLVSVTDKKGRPVDGVDVTAYAFTSKFESYSLPSIPVGGKVAYAKQFNNARYKPEESALTNRKVDMTWQKWKSTMTLDTMAYYRFLYPENYYAYREPTPDGSTRIAPFVVIDGELQGIHILWIDDRIYYVNQAQQLDAYSFRVAPGKHKLRFRTHDREILAAPVVVEKGMTNILSFNAAGSYTTRVDEGGENLPFALSSKLLDKEEQGTLSKREVNSLASQLITVDNNFGSIQLPNLPQRIDLPAHINSGDKLYFLNYTPRHRYDQTLGGNVNSAILAGPFPARNLLNGMSDVATVYADGKPLANIGLEGGNNYTLYKDYQKIKSWKRLPFNRNIASFKPKTNFREQPLTESKIEEYHRNRIANILSGSRGTPENKKNEKDDKKVHTCRLNLSLGKDGKGSEIKPSFIFIIPEKKEDIANYRLYYGGTRNFRNLPAGVMNVSLVFNDSTTYSRTIDMKPNGENYLRIDSIEYSDNSSLAETAYRIFNRNVKKVQTENPYIATAAQKDSIVMIPAQTTASFDERNASKGVVSGTVRDQSGDPIVGATVTIEGTYRAFITDMNGHFELSGKNGDTFNVSYLGYAARTEKYSEGYHYDIVLEEETLPFEEVGALDEVVVVGYSMRKKANLTGAVSFIRPSLSGFSDKRVLEGKVAGLSIRGMNSIDPSAPPLIIVNGMPFDGKLEDLDAGAFTSLSILKDASATAIYGARAANGVIMIQTNALRSAPRQQNERATPATEAGNMMRRNFHDDAFWQPRLKTDKNGEASFEVTYPDDITAWNAYFIAVGDKKQRDKKQMTIQSFKALTARLSTPRFSVRGDSMRVVGRIANHFGDSVSIERTIATPGGAHSKEMTIAASHVDYIPVKAETGDSLTIAYSLQTPTGYFDGEERSLPIIEQGMLQTAGDFKVINDTATHTLRIHPELGAVTIHAEASSLELFLREIDNVDRYPYMCNEQMASKIKALLSKKRIAAIFGKEFTEDKKIDKLIGRLHKNKNPEGLWGWWNNGQTEFWISKQVVGALLDAADAGYQTGLDSVALHMGVEQELKNGLSALRNTSPDRVPLARQELLDRLVLLKRMNAPVDYLSYFRQIDEQLTNRTAADRLKTAFVQSCIGLENEIEIDSLMRYSNKTMLSSLYWGEKREGDVFPRNFTHPYKNNTEHTLIAYNTLKNIGGHESELEKIRNYFFERRQGGAWANTYESSRIIETILPDMLKSGETYSEVVLSVNDRPITRFPYTDKIETGEPVRIKKKGVAPLFVTAYQQEWNKNPEAESSKGFAVSSHFTANNDTAAWLTAGKTVLLEITVRADADAEYVQIEAPIPAGCSYETKERGNFRKEAHREYFKEKVVVFCNKLQKGEHTFAIELIPRYTGLYSLNPAKAELMYFPVFYGNEQLKQIAIESE